MADKIKFALALLFLIAGVAGFYMLGEQAMFVRVLVVLVGVAVSTGVARQTEPGREFFGFALEAKKEAEKVVWPTRKETLQTTGLVFVFVVIMAVFLWLTDKSIEWVLYDIILQWRKS